MFILCAYTFVQCALPVVLIFNLDCDFQHVHIKNIKTLAELLNIKNVFMCILCFHAHAGYLKHYETLLKELNTN
jgi:hypothetical protein